MTTRSSGEPELGALLGGALRRVLAMERPILAAHGIGMWEYVALSALGRGGVRSQAALADAIGADRTRLIAVLDRLQADGLISREPDPGDRRVRLLALTAAGQARRTAIHADIAAGERDLLGGLDPVAVIALRSALAALGHG